MNLFPIYYNYFIIPSNIPVSDGPVDFGQPSVHGDDDHHVVANAQTSFVRTLREIVGRLERDVQEAAARPAQPHAVQEEFQPGTGTDVGVRWRRRGRQRRGDIAQGQAEGPADIEQQNDRGRGRMQTEPDGDRVLLRIGRRPGTGGPVSPATAHKIR